MRLRHAFVAALVCALAGAPTALAKDHHGHHGHHQHHAKTVDVQVVGINDFHGNLEPPSGLVNGQAAGGIEYLATHVKALEQRNPKRTVVVSAGDLIGASPLLSALFHDEPTIEAMNKLGLDVNSVGNHEFDVVG
jgi:5'-nucleotidase